MNQQKIKTEIINIGDELLIGQVVNTNASWMSEKMNLAGFAVERVTVIRDDEQEILGSLEEASRRSDIVLITGGLGPTKDDITKKTFCRYFGTGLVFNQEAYENIYALFTPRGFVVTPLNCSQAEVPANCIAILNVNGTAPGMWFEEEMNGRKVIFMSMPGVPFEMKTMMEERVIPMLREKFHPPVIRHKTILTQGVGESFLSDMIEEWELALPSNIRLAYLPQPGVVRLRLTGEGDDLQKLSEQIAAETGKLRSLIGQYIFGEDDDTLEEITGKLLLERKETLAVAESCTGGYIGHLITSVPGSSAYFRGGTIAYSNEIKQSVLGVQEFSLIQHGAVSETVVREMAEGARRVYGSTWAIATSGIAGPGGATAEKPVGLTWIAIAGPEGTVAGWYLFGENRERNIRKAALQALNLLRKSLIEPL